jgi:hypothetical protein
MRKAPDSPEVFTNAILFAETCLGSDEDLAFDIFSRLESLIPFQRLAEIPQARKSVEKLRAKFEEAQGLSSAIPITDPTQETSETSEAPMQQDSVSESFKSRLQFLQRNKSKIPLEAKAVLLQRFRRELEYLAESLASESDADWKAWAEEKDLLEAEERDYLFEQYTRTLKADCDEWMRRADSLIKETSEATSESVDFSDLGQRIKIDLDKSVSLFNELSVFANAVPDRMTIVTKEFQDRYVCLERCREWIYNLAANYAVDSFNRDLDNIKKQQKSVKQVLIALAAYDEYRLFPYISLKYNELWKKLFEELKEESDKIEITKRKVLKQLPDTQLSGK